MLKNIHHSLRIDLSSIALLLYTARIFASNWNLIFNYYFCNFYKTLSYYFNNIVYIFYKWLSTIFRKYWYLMNDKDRSYWKKVDTYAILCCLVKSLNCVVYEHILIKRIIEEVKRTLTAVNVSRVFIQFLILVLFHFIEAARTSLLNKIWHLIIICKIRFHQ